MTRYGNVQGGEEVMCPEESRYRYVRFRCLERFPHGLAWHSLLFLSEVVSAAATTLPDFGIQTVRLRWKANADRIMFKGRILPLTCETALQNFGSDRIVRKASELWNSSRWTSILMKIDFSLQNVHVQKLRFHITAMLCQPGQVYKEVYSWLRHRDQVII